MVSKEYKQFSIRFIHIALGFIVFTLPTSSIADTRYIHFEVLEISFNDLVKPIANYKVNAKSVIDCSRKCFNSDTCLSVVYHQEMDECYFNTQQVFLQPGAVIPSLSSSYSLVPLTADSWVRLPEIATVPAETIPANSSTTVTTAGTSPTSSDGTTAISFAGIMMVSSVGTTTASSAGTTTVSSAGTTTVSSAGTTTVSSSSTSSVSSASTSTVSAAGSSCTGSLTACPTHWVSHGDSCYLFNTTDLVTWAEASQRCSQAGDCSYLARVETDSEDEFLRETLTVLGVGGSGAWIGGNDIETEGNWLWGYPDGEVMTYYNWGWQQPNNNIWYGEGDEDCLVLGYTTGFYWVDYPCSYPTYYICEAEMSGQK